MNTSAPWPKTYTFCRRSAGASLRVILGPVAVLDVPAAAPPGTVLEATGDRLVVAAGQGAVHVATLQPAGKRMLPAAEFLRGYRVQPGDQFGAE